MPYVILVVEQRLRIIKFKLLNWRKGEKHHIHTQESSVVFSVVRSVLMLLFPYINNIAVRYLLT